MDREQFRRIQSRRRFFQEVAGGIGTIALSQLMAGEGRAATAEVNPLAPRKPHFPPKAKNVIFMFMEGGPSQLDLFDPKPELQKWSGKPLPESMTKTVRFAFLQKETATLMGLPSAGRARAFFAFWTYKEAFIKAKGGGLGIQLADFDVCVEPDGLARLTRTAWDPEETGRWSLRALPAPPGFAAAIAIERRLAHVIVVPASHLRSAARRER